MIPPGWLAQFTGINSGVGGVEGRGAVIGFGMGRAGLNPTPISDRSPRHCLSNLFQVSESFRNYFQATSRVLWLSVSIGCWFGAGAMAAGLAFEVAEAGLWLLETTGSNPV